MEEAFFKRHFADSLSCTKSWGYIVHRQLLFVPIEKNQLLIP